MKKVVYVLLCALFATPAFSQQRKETRNQKKEERKERIKVLIKQEEEGALIFHKQNTFGVKLYSDGYSAFYELGLLKTPVKTSLYSLEIGERKHPKEEKWTAYRNSGGPFFLGGNPYVFGKINNFYFAKLGYGQQRLIGGKGNKNGVAISAIYGGGLSAGLLKPYYLSVNNTQNEAQEVKYNNNDSIFLSTSAINGAAGFGKGLGEMKFVPGGFAKAALRFDYGRYNEVVSAIEVGLGAEIYSQKMPILLRNKERQFFFNAYAAIVFGKRK